MTSRTTTALLAPVLLLSFGGTIHAADDSASRPNLIGGGIKYQQSIFRGGDDEVRPSVVVEYGNFFVHGPQVGYRFYSTDRWEFNTGIALSSFGTDRGEGVEPIDHWVDAFVGTAFTSGMHQWRLRVNTDTSDKHDGQSIHTEYGLRFPGERLQVTPYVGVSWWSKKLTDYVVGVDGGANDYQADATVNSHIGVRVNWALTRQHLLQFDLQGTKYGNEVTDSPLVDKDRSSHLLLNYVYRFTSP
ncbi:MAG: MipA/OmpV family protein [Gammaproteobacteria bacterium]|nr:MipA/OmpV family protein [Gammaproteobacteria bacterium]